MTRLSLLFGSLLVGVPLALAQPVPLPNPVPKPAPAPNPGPPAPPAPDPQPPVPPVPPAPVPPVPVPNPTPPPSPVPTGPADPRKDDTPGAVKPVTGATPAPVPTPTGTPAPKNIDDTVKGYDKTEGLWTLYRKVENNHQKIFAELTPAQVDNTYLLQSTYATGNAARLVAGRPGRDLIFSWKKTPDDRLILSSPNLWYRAKDPNLENAVERDFPNAYLGIFPILARQKERNSVLIDLSGLFDGSVTGLNTALEGTPGSPGGYALDPALTYVESIKDFPLNMVVEAQYNFRGSGRGPSGMPQTATTQADPRSLPVKVVYNLYPVPQDTDVPHGFHPREADPRIGYFINGQLSAGRVGFESFDDDASTDPSVRYINRWRLEKALPNAKLSPPMKPITFILDDSIPQQYRQAVREGILMWNQAFLPLGYEDVIVVKDPPAKDWDHADMRYNVIRWVASPPTDGSAYAVAQMRENPLTGEILNASINVNANFARFAFREKLEVVNPLDDVRKPKSPAGMGAPDGVACSLDEGSHAMAEWGREAIIASGLPLNDKRYVNDMLRSTVGHEFGHILGLRHNFIASTFHSPAALADPAEVRRSGISASLMDYVGFNLFGLKTGADLFGRAPGKYDVWAIDYGYADLPVASEAAGLKGIASHSNEPGLAYETDGAVDGYDPTISRYDLSSDPLAYAEKSFAVNHELLFSLKSRFPRPGETYALFTRRMRGLLVTNVHTAVLASNYIGGARLRRAVAGDKGEKLPFQPVVAVEQRRALTILCQNIFAAAAFPVPEKYFSYTQGDPYAFEDSAQDNGFPLRDTISAARAALLNDLLSGDRLRLMANQEYKFPAPGQVLPIIELLPALRQAIWGQRGALAVVSPLQRDLQREHLRILIELETGKRANAPADARAVAENELHELKALLIKPRTSSPDAYTRLHFAEAIRRIDTALRDKLQ